MISDGNQHWSTSCYSKPVKLLRSFPPITQYSHYIRANTPGVHCTIALIMRRAWSVERQSDTPISYSFSLSLSLLSLWSKLVCQFTNMIYVPSLIRSRSCSRSGWRYWPGQILCTYHTALPILSIVRPIEGAQPTTTLKQFRGRARALLSEYSIRRSYRSLPHPCQTSK